MTDTQNSSVPARSPLFPVLLTMFIDMVGVGVAIPVLATALLDPSVGLAPGASHDMRNILYGLLVAIFPLAQFFGAPILGAMSDRHGRRGLLMLSIFGTMLSYVLFAVGLMLQNITLLFASRALAGFSGGNLSIANSVIADVSDPTSRARNFGLIGMAFGLGFILGPFLGGKLSDPGVASWFTFATPFWFAAFLSMLNVFSVWKFLPETLKTRRSSAIDALTGLRNIRKALSLGSLRTVLLVIFIWTLGINFFFQFYQVFLIGKFHFDQGDIGNLFGFIGICIALVQGILTRPLSKHFAPDRILRVTLLGLAASIPLLLIPDKVWSLYLFNGLIAVWNGLTFPNVTALVSNMAGKESQGEALGISQSVQSLGTIVPPLLGGFLANISISLPLIVGSASVFLAWLVFMIAFKALPREKFHEI
jgi:MFS transporter, DHA1 family, tetracycline resistance protein